MHVTTYTGMTDLVPVHRRSSSAAALGGPGSDCGPWTGRAAAVGGVCRPEAPSCRLGMGKPAVGSGSRPRTVQGGGARSSK